MRGETAAVERVFREEYGRLIASLVRRFGDIDVAEEAAGEALVAALETWPESGVPPNPGGWLTTTAGNRAIDRIRRDRQRDAKHQAAFPYDDNHAPPQHTGPVEDDRLRLLFTCCHPALAPEARIALTLRLLGGLTVAEIARAFLVPETTMARRITRAKKKIATAKVPYRVPEAADLPERLGGVLTVLFLVFNEGYLATGDGDPVRAELAGEAIRLTRILRQLLREEPEVAGLLALLVLTEARREARIRDGELVPLGEQDRAGWDRALIAEGHHLVRECLAINRPGRYQILAAINAVHTDAPTASDTDWSQVVALYDQLTRLDPSPIVALNRAVAVAELDGPTVALALIDRLPLQGYHAWHAARADLLRRLGRSSEARDEFDAAIAATQNSAERAYLSRKRGYGQAMTGVFADDQLEAFLAQQPFAGAPLDVEALRAGVADRTRQRTPGPAMAQVADLTVGDAGGIGARLYRPGKQTSPLVVYLHGGGWTIGGLDSHDRLCRRLAARSGLSVLALDYRLAPEHPWPAAVDDTVAALRFVAAGSATLGGRPERVAVCGDSAGGTLAALGCLRLRVNDPGALPDLQVLLYANTDLTGASPSMREKATGFGLDASAVRFFASRWVPDQTRWADPGVSPLHAPDLSGLPAALVVTAEHDPLRDEGEAYAGRLRDAGIEVMLRRESGLVHNFLMLDEISPACAAAADRVADDLAARLAG